MAVPQTSWKSDKYELWKLCHVWLGLVSPGCEESEVLSQTKQQEVILALTRDVSLHKQQVNFVSWENWRMKKSTNHLHLYCLKLHGFLKNLQKHKSFSVHSQRLLVSATEQSSHFSLFSAFFPYLLMANVSPMQFEYQSQ